MSEGNAGANEALRVEFSTFLKLYVRLRANWGNWVSWKVYCKLYVWAPRKLG